MQNDNRRQYHGLPIEFVSVRIVQRRAYVGWDAPVAALVCTPSSNNNDGAKAVTDRMPEERDGGGQGRDIRSGGLLSLLENSTITIKANGTVHVWSIISM